MPPDAVEQHGVSLVGYHDLEARPAFKIDLQVVDDRWYLYLGHFWHRGWSVLDVTDPAAPEYLRYVEGPENTSTGQVQVADGLLVTSLEKPIGDWGHVDGPKPDLDAPFEESAYVWDVETDPADPALLGQWSSGGEGTHRNFYNGGDYAYLCARLDGIEGFRGKALCVVDLSDPTDPEEVARWWWPGQGPGEADEDDERFYFHGPAYVRDDRAYLSYGSVGAIVLDVADPTDPEYLTHVDFGDLGSWLGCHSFIPLPGTDLAVVNDEAILEGSPLDADGDPMHYVFVVDVSDERAPGWDGQERVGPKLVSAVPTPTPGDDQPYSNYHERAGRFGPHNQHHYREGSPRLETSDLLFTTWFNAGLRVYDISDPLAPREAGHYVPGDPERRIGHPRPGSGLVSTLEDVVVDERGYIYCSDPQQGLFVLETDLL